MPGAAKEQTLKEFEKSLHINNVIDESHAKKRKRKSKYHRPAIGSTMSKEKNNFESKDRRSNDSTRGNLINEATMHQSKPSKKKSSSGENPTLITSDENVKHANGVAKSRKLKRRGKRKRSKDTAEVDEASRLQRRARNLMIKMKFEQNLLDAYSGEGWKGQSREKIRPEKELQRAMKQILKCKLGIRDAIHQLDALSSEGCIEDSAIAPDGSVYHEHIFCAKCKLRDAFLDNDIILCDGTCNCGFHQKCLDPPLLTENIPQGDQGWFCKICECKMDILDAMNAHIGTHFSVDSNWQDIFKEEAALPDGGDALLHPEEEWPSDDSDDDDYDPENFENSCNQSRAESVDNASESASGSSSLCLLEGDLFFEADSDDTTDCEILSGRRQRRAVDYKKLYDEMFGKDAPVNEQISEDEDWGPTKRKRREKESDAASTLMTLCESEKKCPNENTEKVKDRHPSKNTRRHFFRIPPHAVEKLRCVFAENELPSKAVRDNLSEQLGLDSEKVNKWFKNARYLALKARKIDRRKSFVNVSPRISKEDISENGKEEKPADQMLSKVLALAADVVVQTPKSLTKTLHARKKLKKLLTSPSKKRQRKKALLWSPIKNKASEELGDDMSLKLLREKAKREKKVAGNAVQEAEAEAEMERLCKIKGKLEKLHQVLLALPNRRDSPTLDQHSVIYIPIAELREKKI